MVVWHSASLAVIAMLMPGWHALSCLQQKLTTSMPCSVQAGELLLQEPYLQRIASMGSCHGWAMVPALLAVIMNAGSLALSALATVVGGTSGHWLNHQEADAWRFSDAEHDWSNIGLGSRDRAGQGGECLHLPAINLRLASASRAHKAA